MSKHGPRYTTAFNDDETTPIKSQIQKLSENHNRLIRDTLEIDIDDWRYAVLSPEMRELALQTQAAFGDHIDSGAYMGSYLTGLAHDKVWADWTGHPLRFPRPADPEVPLVFYTDGRAGAFVERLYECCREWHMSAVDYGMVLDVFEFLNGAGPMRDGFCAKGDRRHLRTLLPCIVPLISKFDRDLAASLSKPLTGGNRPALPMEYVEGVVRANQIIAGGLLLPEYPKKGHHVTLGLTIGEVSHPAWPRKFDPLCSL